MFFLPLAVVVLSAAPSPLFTWSVTSPSGAARLSQTALPNEACSLECEVSGKPAWKAQSCLGRGTDFAFVSNDCGSTFVLFEYPPNVGTPGATPVAVSMTGGAGLRVFRLSDLGAPTRGEGRRVRWLGGVVGEPGVKPHVNGAETGIEFMTLDGQVHTVRFGNADDFVPRRAAPPPSSATPSTAMYQFIDAEGSTQFVMGLANVPKQFRKGARPVDSEIGSIEGGKPPAPSPSPAGTGTRLTGSSPPPGYTGTAEQNRARFYAPPPPPKPAVDDPNDPTKCHIFGLPGPACQAVQAAERQRGR